MTLLMHADTWMNKVWTTTQNLTRKRRTEYGGRKKRKKKRIMQMSLELVT
jgi:hypothetical protein